MGPYCFEEYNIGSWILASDCSYLAGFFFFFLFNNDQTTRCDGELSILETVQVLLLDGHTSDGEYGFLIKKLRQAGSLFFIYVLW